MRACCAALLLGLSAGTCLAADEQPRLRPTADVDVTYRLTGPARPGAAVLQQRMRWLAALQTMRVDPPTKGFHVIIDYLAGRMNVVRETEKSVVEMNAPAGVAAMPGSAAAHRYIRRGEETVAGMSCTDWETTDSAGRSMFACIKPDGVLLRVRMGDQTLVDAVAVRYAPQDPLIFKVPPDYRREKAGGTP